MNKLFESVNRYFDFDVEDFESMIPNNMRFKCWKFVDGETLYWVTQEDFSEEDLLKFVDAMKSYGIKTAAVTVRDLSCYDYNGDREGDDDVLCYIELDESGDHYMLGDAYRQWYDRVNGLDESDKTIDSCDPYDLGFTEEDLRNNLNLKFIDYGDLNAREKRDFPLCDSILYFDVYYGDIKVGETQCYGAKDDNVEEYFSQVINNIIDNPFGMDFSKVRYVEESQSLKESAGNITNHGELSVRQVKNLGWYDGNVASWRLDILNTDDVINMANLMDKASDIFKVGNRICLYTEKVNGLGGRHFSDFVHDLHESEHLDESAEYCLVLPKVKSDEEMDKVIEALKDLGYEAHYWTR